MPEIKQLLINESRKLSPLTPVRKKMGAKVDALICCAGFEERAVAITKDVAFKDVGTVIVVTYPTNCDDNSPAIKEFRRLRRSRMLTEIQYDRSTFLYSISTILRELNLPDSAHIVVDVSAMASYLISRVFAALFRHAQTCILSVYYSEAKEYSPSSTEWDVFIDGVENQNDNLMIAERYEQTWFQSRGLGETYESDVFPGRNPDPLATKVIAIPSFSLQRMKAMLTFASSNYNVPNGNLVWMIGVPPNESLNGWRSEALRVLYNVRDECCSVSTMDYRETLLALDTIWTSSAAESHLVLADMGSKMQHLAVYLFLRMHSECGLIHCEPESFLPQKYSVGIGNRWCIEFGSLSELDGALASAGNLAFEW